MKLQEGGGGIAGTSGQLARIRSFDDAEEQTDDQITPQQRAELLRKFRRTALE
jgi:hypothetical protein